MIWGVLCLLVLPFAFVLLYGAPYLPTRREQAEQALDMLGLTEGEVFVDLGCGDGALLIAAARRGLRCYGYELNPFVWAVAVWRTRKFRDLVTVRCKNFWKITLQPETKGVFVFLLDKYMPKLDTKLSKELKKGSQLVSYTFQIPGKKPKATQGALHLYKY
jgi:SAM-dependent methyltransferase